MLSGIGIAAVIGLVGFGVAAGVLSIAIFRRGKLYQWLNPEANPVWVLRIYLPTFLLALGPPLALAYESAKVGIHSTPGIWLMILSLPGVIAGAWASSALGEDDLVFYVVVTTLANWAFYVCLVIGALWLKRELSKEAISRPVE